MNLCGGASVSLVAPATVLQLSAPCAARPGASCCARLSSCQGDWPAWGLLSLGCYGGCTFVGPHPRLLIAIPICAIAPVQRFPVARGRGRWMSWTQRLPLARHARVVPPVAPVRSAGELWGLAAIPSWAFWAGDKGWLWATSPVAVARYPCGVSVCVIVEDYPLRRRGWHATPAPGSSRPFCSPAPSRCPGGSPSGPRSRSVRAAAVRLRVGERPEGAPLWAVGGGHVGR